MAHFFLVCTPQASAQSRHDEIRFDIPDQALADALVAFAKTSGLEILVDDSLIAGRRSTAISGTFYATIALRRMLAETGLEIRYVDKGAVTLLPHRAPGQRTGELAYDPYASFSAALQVALLRTMCAYDSRDAAAYRVAAQLWIGPDGIVERSLLLDSTGDRERDATISSLLEKLTIGQARPTGLPQPATVIVTPRSTRDSGDCETFRRAGTAR